eukprot:TRINITY_DN5118_c0_g1_i1.p1 TRINITY_DN5118_c0_g1~~TRINITY_DN5118_c0_g1_i1.p1  ORF type:complete len:395 (+),score=44.35 TRINITY_DN5118_c0_g1_i1:24-1208(+)
MLRTLRTLPISRVFRTPSFSRCSVHPLLSRPFSNRRIIGHVLGQPIFETHPHLIKEGELTPGVRTEEFTERRAVFATNLPQNSITILASHPENYMSNDIPYTYRQHSDFLYLTGFQEPDSFLIVEKPTEGPVTYSIFVPPFNPKKLIWDGPRSGKEGMQKYFKFDKVFAQHELEQTLSSLLGKYTSVCFDPTTNSRVHKILSDAKRKMLSPLKLIHYMRLIKSDSEIELMRRSGKAAAEAMTETMRATRPGMTEYQLAAKMEFECKWRGARRLAYPVVCASGTNALILHYLNNDHVLNDGDLVLMDAGCELEGYASDITRTWPINGKFSEEQLQVYNVVLEANKKCVDAVKSGSNMHAIHRLSAEVIHKGLSKLGIDLDEVSLVFLWCNASGPL